ncbi:MAG: hypothetical protein ACYTXA_25395 [Nostoc sp.]
MRRTGKVGGDNQPKTGSQQSAETGTQNIQARLQENAQKGALLAADNYQAEFLMTFMTTIQQGNYGPKTAAILEAWETGSTSPLEDWGDKILTWHQPIALLPSSNESTPS